MTNDKTAEQLKSRDLFERAVEAFQLAELAFGERMQERGVLFDPALGVEAGLIAALPFLQSTRDDSGEAVAWRYRHAVEPSGWTTFISKARAEFLRVEGYIVEPLFTQPRATAVDVRDAKLRAFRNRFVSERTTTWLRDGLVYEVARAKAEAELNEYEDALETALSRRVEKVNDKSRD